MYFLALATDYDGTIAHDGLVPDATLESLVRLKESGRLLIMVTGRELPDLERVFPPSRQLMAWMRRRSCTIRGPGITRDESADP